MLRYSNFFNKERNKAVESPTSVGGMVFWLDANASNTITSSSGNVSQWTSKRGSISATQAGADSAKPDLIDPSINGLPAVDGDGLGEFLTLGLPDLDSTFVGQDRRFSIFWVAKADANSGFQLIFAKNGGASEKGFFYGLSNGIPYMYTAFNITGTAARGIIGNTAVGTTNPFLLEMHYDGTVDTPTDGTGRVQHLLNGALQTNTAAINSGTITDVLVDPAVPIGIFTAAGSGASALFDGQLGEFIVFNRTTLGAMSEADRQAVRDYLNNKWGL